MLKPKNKILFSITISALAWMLYGIIMGFPHFDLAIYLVTGVVLPEFARTDWQNKKILFFVILPAWIGMMAVFLILFRFGEKSLYFAMWWMLAGYRAITPLIKGDRYK